MRPLTLDSPVIALGPIATRYARALHTAGISHLRDLLFYYPYRYEDWSNVAPIKTLVPGSEAVVQGTVSSIALKQVPWRGRPNVEAILTDESGDVLKTVWYNSPFLVNSLPVGTTLLLSGKVERMKGTLQLIHPQWEKVASASTQGRARIMPVYHLSGSLTQKILRNLSANALKRIARIPDYLPSWIIQRARLVSLDLSLRAIHLPHNWASQRKAEERLKFDELFFLQLRGALARRQISQLQAILLAFDQTTVKTFVNRLPFSLTQAQRKAAWEIIKDLGKPHPMNRLLEGDVGSGKTAVAAIASLNVVHAGHQVAYLAPTSILAVQHFETFCKLFSGTNIRIAVLTQGDIRIRYSVSGIREGVEKKSKKAIYAKLMGGEIDIVIGTHALLNPYLTLPRLALVIVDEQHRFGVRQRHQLLLSPPRTVAAAGRFAYEDRASQTPARPLQPPSARAGGGPRRAEASSAEANRASHATVPHLLSMTATPIPRSLALVAYGDLDLSILDEMPKGRAAITTKIVNPSQRKEAYALIHEELKKDRQAFIICPLIDPSDTLGAKSVKLEAERLKREHFPHASLSMLHGRLSASKKDEIMKHFSEGKTHVLVATPVVEVGIDVPNATIILIESAERFGLAQLHQLRGRVGRSTFPSYCLLATDTESEAAIERLHAVVSSQNGFALAEKDLAMRGPGEVYGTTQTGFLDELKIAKLTDAILLKQSKEAITRLLNMDPALQRYPAIAARLAQFEQSVHLE